MLNSSTLIFTLTPQEIMSLLTHFLGLITLKNLFSIETNKDGDGDIVHCIHLFN